MDVENVEIEEGGGKEQGEEVVLAHRSP